MEDQGVWTCNNCGNTDGVISGVCPDCGPTQTTPVDETAKKLGGFYEAEAEKEAQATTEAEAVVNTETTEETDSTESDAVVE